MAELDTLQEPDSRTLAFLPGGLGLGLQMSAQDAAEYWCGVAKHCTLDEDVAEQTRRAFADLTAVLPYGVLRYEIFTLVHDRALFVLEQGLRERLTELGSVHRLGSLDLLLKQARSRGLLEGQRSSVVEIAIRSMRNSIAHADGYHLLMPPMAALSVSDLAEILNHLWGHNTAGGRLYPAPLARQTVVIARDSVTSASAVSLAENLADPAGWDEFSEYLIVQAEWPAEPTLHDYDPWFEMTTHAVAYRWGPGTRDEALCWLESHPAASDTVEVLGRRFLVRTASHRLWWPMRLEAAAALPADWRGGRWFLVGADAPQQAFAHVRSAVAAAATCTLERRCPGCGAVNLDHGSLRAILARAAVEVDDAAQFPPFHAPGPITSHMPAGMPVWRR